MISCTASLKDPVGVIVARFVYSAWKRATSAVVSGRRNAFCPNAVMNCPMQVALSVVHGSTLARAVVLAMTCVASESEAAWKPSHARWSTLPSVSGASIVDGCTSSPSRSRVVLSYSARVSRGSCDVAGMPGVHTVGSTGGGRTVVPAVPLPAVPVPTVLPVPTLPAVPLPELDPDPELCFPVPIEPSQPARSAAPTMIVLFQVFMTLTSVPGG